MIDWFDTPITVGGKPEQEVILDRDVKHYWTQQPHTVLVTSEPSKQSVNPCVTKFGPGPEGQICRDCVHLHGFRQSATWYKCDLRQWRTKGGKYPGTVNPGKDHRVRWPVCAKYEKREEEYHGG